MTRYSIAGVILAITSVVVGAGWIAQASSETAAADQEQQGRRLNLAVQRIQAVNEISRPREFTGTIKAARESRISFERPGRIIDIHVDEGAKVVQGQLLATIDVRDVAAQLEATVAQHEQAQAVMNELEEGPRKETIASTQAQVVRLDAQVKRLKRDFERAQSLIETESISQERFDTAQFSYEAAVAERDAVNMQLEELLAGTRQEQLDAQQAVVKQLAAQVKSLELDVQDGELHAPFAGRIAERLLDEGTVVTAGTEVFRLVEDDKLEAWIGIPPLLASGLNIGASYPIYVEGKSVNAMVASRRPQLDSATRTQNVILTIDDSHQAIVPGQIVRLSLAEAIPASGFVLPSSSFVPGTRGLWKVFVANETERVVEQRNVEVLYTLGEEALVSGTLQDGDAVIVDGIHRVVAGQQFDSLSWQSDLQQRPKARL